MKAHTSNSTLPDTPVNPVDAPTVVLAPVAVPLSPGERPARDAWHETFMLARSFQEDLNWEDFLMPSRKAGEIIELLVTHGQSLLVLNGISGEGYTWLWLSPDSIGYIQNNRPDLLNAVAIKRSYYLSVKAPETPTEKGREMVHVFELDAQTSIRNHRRPVRRSKSAAA